MKTTPIALTIAGSDSGGGAGIQADLKAFSANQVYGASVITAVTAQNTCAVTAVHEIPADVVHAQIDAVLQDLKPQAIKLGMLFSPAIIRAVAKALSDYDGTIILDPVMIAKSGDALLQEEAVATLKSDLLPHVDLLTPNLPEAAKLLGTDAAQDQQSMQDQAYALLELGPSAVLMKGGHSTGETCTDLLLTGSTSPLSLSASRVNTRNTHGTGCTYSAAIAAQVARGLPLTEAVTAAHEYLNKAIVAADDLTIGSGHGPVHHFHAIWG
ncbi:bifunctional hydroxymethylpyrimidine kinase/phosphomethylpyrimidine kinase [Sedimentitalea sp. CY04]|uniref:hydroxymethylpyrimidine kinase n=1 Tax=Parasedimentitalea denitrificans TaxID=2211118 RepID=A0ABX0WFM4_9RHOB|nr:bifunctional hydroxymethylpyrimidine kinase/phosphomethylpyrimidine kinase [Sedimentitalea sp. CY04]NIZ63151.1 bifunctional hydroxymethylpyrimidine kinase/phosphomethylpyrimidine kinase [Sedimentitalea sp. CY04]